MTHRTVDADRPLRVLLVGAGGMGRNWIRTIVANPDVQIVGIVDLAPDVATVDRLADLFAATYVGWWEWAARRDPVLAQLGLSPDQCCALVALLAGSRRYRHNGKRDSLLAAVRTATELGAVLRLSADQRRRLAVFAGTVQHPRGPMATARALAAGV
jgi:hypothetical protein